MVLREVGCNPEDWIDLAEDRDQWWGLCNVSNEHPVP